MAAKAYPIRTSSAEFDRLGMQSDLFRDDAAVMLDRLGIEPGWRCLDLCCGIGGITDVLSDKVGPGGSVVGADMDADKLAYARDWAAANALDTVSFEQADAFATGFAAASFDLVHCRFALSVIAGGLGILDHMLSLARPGGIVFLEEVNARTIDCVPGSADWDEALALVSDTFTAIGADTTLGPKLYGILLAKGLEDLRVRPCLYALTPDDPMTLHLPDTLAAMQDTIVSLGLMPADEVAGLAERVQAHVLAPGTLTISYSMFQVAGRLPKQDES
jgi:ubiquinone/menaquinone biosynthesis C-methylase UbiE